MYPGLGMELVSEEPADIAQAAGIILLCIPKGRDELIQIALIAGFGHFDQCLVLVIRDQRVLRTVNPELMKGRAYL